MPFPWVEQPPIQWTRTDTYEWTRKIAQSLRSLIDRTRFRGAMVNLTSTESISGGVATMIPWDAAEYQEGGTWWTAAANTRLTVPSGVDRVRLHISVHVTGGTVNQAYYARAIKNGTDIYYFGSPVFLDLVTTTAAISNSAGSAVLEVEEGDYFECEFRHGVTSPTHDCSVLADTTAFSAEAVT